MIIFLIFNSGSVEVFATDLAGIRKSFHLAVLDKGKISDFQYFVKEVDRGNPTIMAYQAASAAMSAQLEWNPVVKYDLVKKYDKTMSAAVSKDPDNLEILFLRMSIEYHLPRFLGFSVHLEDDKEKIMNRLSTIHELNYGPAFSKFILYFLKDSGLCSGQEMIVILDMLARI